MSEHPHGQRRLPVLTPTMVRELEELMVELNGDVHDLVNLLAALRGQMQLMKDVLRLALDQLQRVDKLKPPGGPIDEKPPTG